MLGLSARWDALLDLMRSRVRLPRPAVGCRLPRVGLHSAANFARPGTGGGPGLVFF